MKEYIVIWKDCIYGSSSVHNWLHELLAFQLFVNVKDMAKGKKKKKKKKKKRNAKPFSDK